MGVPLQKLSLAEFLAWENAQPEKHEFHRGEVFAMVGGRRSHGRAILNFASSLLFALKGSPCQVFADSMKVQVADDTVLYPDIFVTCDKVDLATDQIFRSPLLVIEVLSPSTQAYDRSQKFALYRRLASLQEYVLVDPETRRVEAFRRTADNQWLFVDMSAEAAIRLASIDHAIPLADVFDGIDPPA
jgi:Uma2 family endonuclease